MQCCNEHARQKAYPNESSIAEIQMLNISQEDIQFFNKYLPNIDVNKLIKNNDRRGMLLPLDDLIFEEGFAPPDFEYYNDFGEEAQRVYDRIYADNI